MKAYSQDLRERIVKMVAEAKTKAETAWMLGVSLNTVKRMVKLDQTQSNLAPKIRLSQKSKLSSAEQSALLEQVEANPDKTLAWYCLEYGSASTPLKLVQVRCAGRHGFDWRLYSNGGLCYCFCRSRTNC